ncbi:LysM peptidoglycan-binding domain-containing protein [Halopseudomonas pelagia]|uniref:LysM peptidoglycan-binding domain-containing protein n=1 Tax=Halopseudomonas pelagia TaxID=553151 RepID=UPI0003AAA151|nr:LysM domain-containing protein [Halopseudomonas pelagia]|tara:strand:+ start:1219 stop:4659 length:3441 start_codon:yes stop_codon:yes gene_type:complete
MELGNHTVVSGDNLSKIAARYGASVEQLRQLNPFIKDANHIQLGWNLSVPAQSGSSTPDLAGTAQETPVAAQQPQNNDGNTGEALALGPLPQIPESCASFSDNSDAPCTNTFATVIYSTEERKFWLLPEQASDAIKEAIEELADKISPDKSAEDRKRGLDETGLLEYFMEPKLTNFLQGEDLERALAIEAEIPDIADLDRAKLRIAGENDIPVNILRRVPHRALFSTEGREELRDQEVNLRRLRQMTAYVDRQHNEWRQLQAKARREALSQGYSYENGTLFSPEAIEARRRVQDYLNKRNAIMSDGNIPEHDIQSIAATIDEAKQYHSSVESCTGWGRGNIGEYCTWKRESEAELKYIEYADSIIKVADYGLALPEYALISSPQSSIYDGVEEFRKYLDAELEQAQINESLQKKYRNWVESTGANMQPPAGLVEAERRKWDELQKRREALKEQAEQNVIAGSPRRHLLWNPEAFSPRPVDRLVRTGFPLREMSLPDDSDRPVRAMSLFNLEGIAEHLKESFQEHVVDGAVKAMKRIPVNNGTGLSSASDIFEEWLNAQGAHALLDQAGGWFDEDGWFDVEQFYRYLTGSNIRVEMLESDSVRAEWGGRLKQVLFRADIREEMRLFDASPQAQLVRCLTPPQRNLHASASASGPSFSVAEGIQTSVQASLGIDLARGEVELFSLDMPPRSEATDLTVKYTGYNNEAREVSIGRYSVHLSARAWGYAGASLLLAAKIELTPNGALWGKSELKTDEEAKRGTHNSTHRSAPLVSGRAAGLEVREGAQASFNLFAGVQAGVQLTGALNWAPPSGLAAIRAIPGGGVGSTETSVANQWLSMAELNVGIAAAAGVGAEANAKVSLQNGQLILIIKAAAVAGLGVKGEYSFAVSYEGVVELLHIFRRELHRNHGVPLLWIDTGATDYFNRLNTLASAGLGITMLSLLAVDTVMSLYEALTRPGRAGPLALSIVTYEPEAELAQWFVEATPEALGPMLMTLTSTPRGFTPELSTEVAITGISEKGESVNSEQSNLWQQEAIERILRWIVSAARQSPEGLENARHQFGRACLHMNQYGVAEANPTQAYRRNSRRLDAFMATLVRSNVQRNNLMRLRYEDHVKQLGAEYDAMYQYRRPTLEELRRELIWNNRFRAL